LIISLLADSDDYDEIDDSTVQPQRSNDAVGKPGKELITIL